MSARRWTPRRPSRSPEEMLEEIRAVNPAAAAAMDELIRLLLEGAPDEQAAAEALVRKFAAEFEAGDD